MATTTLDLIRYTIDPTTPEAISYWSQQVEPTELDLILIEWHTKVYPTHRINNEQETDSEYEF
jgi:hypothetical protein